VIDPAFYSGLAAELVAKLRRLASFTRHSGLIGVYHEEIVREALRPLLSRRFSIRTGFTYGGTKTVSAQGDILIVDENDPSPYLFQLGDLVVAQPRALACVIEIKTSLSKSSFHDAINNLRSFRDVAKASSSGAFMTLLFAFESAKLSPDTLNEWYISTSVENDILSYPQMVYVLTRGTLNLQRIPGTDQFGHRFVVGEDADDIKWRGLSIFLQTVRKSLEMKAGLESNPFGFASIQDLKLSSQYLQFGKGLVEPAASA
jgi:hypothetical protein